MDPGEWCGYATRCEDGTLRHGSVRLGVVRPVRYLRLRRLLDEERLHAGGCAGVVVELPTPRGNAARAQYGYLAVVELFAHDAGATLSETYPSSLKKWATGNGRASKEDMEAEARARMGVWPERHDDADALLLLAWAEAGAR